MEGMAEIESDVDLGGQGVDKEYKYPNLFKS